MKPDFNIDLNTIIYYLTSSEIQAKLLPVKIGFLAISGILLLIIIFCLLKSHWIQWAFVRDWTEILTHRPYGAKKITRTWNKILSRLERANEAEYKLAVIEADDMLNNALKRMDYAGQTLIERLQKLTATTLSNIEEIYEAHKVRDQIVHNPDYRLSLDEARKVLDVYGKAFSDLQILT